jgi:hypothetical protein
MDDKLDALRAARSRSDITDGGGTLAELRPATVTRALKIYLLGLVGALAVAAMLMLEPVLYGTTAKGSAEATLTPPPSAEAPKPERSPERFPIASALAGAPERPLAVPIGDVPDRDGGPPQPAPVASPTAPLPTAAVVAVASPGAAQSVAAPSGSLEPSVMRDVPTAAISARPASGSLPAEAAAAVSSRPAQPRLARDAKNGNRSATANPARSPHSPASARQPIARAAQPVMRSSAGLGCPSGSDPRWGEPDGTGAPVLICNPYYPRASVSVF